MDYSNLNKNVSKALNLINKKEYKEAKEILLEYVEKTKTLYKKNNYSFNNLTEFYLFASNFGIKKETYWINLNTSEACRLLGYILIEEKDYDKALEYLKESFKYNPVNVNTFFELSECYKMMKDYDKMKEIIDSLYDYLYNESMLAKYYRNLGFYYIEKENYDLAFSLYLISLEYEFNQFALSEMMYIRKKLDDKDFIIEKKLAVKQIRDNGINIGISGKNLSLLRNLSKDKKIIDEDPNFIKSLRESINKLSKKIG